MPQHIISITTQQFKIIKCTLDDPISWIDSIVSSKISTATNKIIIHATKFNPSKLTQTEIDHEISLLDLDAIRLEMFLNI